MEKKKPNILKHPQNELFSSMKNRGLISPVPITPIRSLVSALAQTFPPLAPFTQECLGCGLTSLSSVASAAFAPCFV